VRGRLVHPDDDEEAGTDAAEQEKGIARVGRLVTFQALKEAE